MLSSASWQEPKPVCNAWKSSSCVSLGRQTLCGLCSFAFFQGQWAKSQSQIFMPGSGHAHSSFQTVKYSKFMQESHLAWCIFLIEYPIVYCTSVMLLHLHQNYSTVHNLDLCSALRDKNPAWENWEAPELIQGKNQDTEPWSYSCFSWKNSALCYQLYSLEHRQILGLISSLFNSKYSNGVLLFMSSL